ncbi:MAG: NAD(+)/NADH kinase [Dehalococcoidia bacterium]
MTSNKVGICYHNRLPAARELAEELADVLSAVAASRWLCVAWDDAAMERYIEGTDLLISVGGDGTMLWAARAALTRGIPVLGISMGSLAFLAELPAADALRRIPTLLRGEVRVEERTTLQAEVTSAGAHGIRYYAVNDVVVARGTAGRPVSLRVGVDGAAVASLRADGAIVATATGSTAYSLSVGGPVLHPQAPEMILSFVSPHMAMARPLVLPATATVELRVETDHQAVLSVDGQVNRPLASGDGVRVTRSPYPARFVRLRPPEETYHRLGHRLGWLGQATE